MERKTNKLPSILRNGVDVNVILQTPSMKFPFLLDQTKLTFSDTDLTQIYVLVWNDKNLGTHLQSKKPTKPNNVILIYLTTSRVNKYRNVPCFSTNDVLIL